MSLTSNSERLALLDMWSDDPAPIDTIDESLSLLDMWEQAIGGGSPSGMFDQRKRGRIHLLFRGN